MTRSISRLLDNLETQSLGFNDFFKDIQNATHYPPHNIVIVSEDKFEIELAIAGFKRDEIKLQEHRGVLTISGEKHESNDTETKSYQYRGIAKRAFSKSFRLAEYFEVEDATLDHGILTVKLVRNTPEEAKPRLISIS